LTLIRARDFVLRRESLIAVVVAAAYFVVYAALSIQRHQTYHSGGFDLGLFDQVFWNTTHGRPFESTMSLSLPVPHSLLGDHFSPALLLLVPFYIALPHPETLLVIQTLALTLGAWPVYLLARLKLPPGYALLWVAVYFLCVPLAYINLDDFHEVALSVAPLGFALYFLERGRTRLFLLSLLLTLLVKEEMALVGAGFGLYALLSKRDWKLGLGVMVGSLLTFAAVIQVVIPSFAGGLAYPYFAERYRDVGGSPSGILTTLLTDPLRIVRTVLQTGKVYFVVGVFGSTLGLSAVAGWASLLVLPTLGYLLLSNYPPFYSFTSQYSAPLIPLVVGTAILGLARLPAPARRVLMSGVVASSLLFSWAYGDMPYSRKFDAHQLVAEPRYALFVRELVRIAPDARVSAETGLTSHLDQRRYMYDYHFEGVHDAEWVVLDYQATSYDITAFQVEVASVEAAGYDQVAGGYGLALLHKR